MISTFFFTYINSNNNFFKIKFEFVMSKMNKLSVDIMFPSLMFFLLMNIYKIIYYKVKECTIKGKTII